MFGFFTEIISGNFMGLPRFLCYVFGTLYPIYKSMQAVSTKGTEDDGHWLTYWIVFSLLNILDFAQDFARAVPLWGFVFKGIPFYYVGKLVIILYLINPVYNGAGHIASLLLPLFSKWAKNLERYDKRMEEFLANNQFNKSAVKQIEGVKPEQLEKAVATAMKSVSVWVAKADKLIEANVVSKRQVEEWKKEGMSTFVTRLANAEANAKKSK